MLFLLLLSACACACLQDADLAPDFPAQYRREVEATDWAALVAQADTMLATVAVPDANAYLQQNPFYLPAIGAKKRGRETERDRGGENETEIETE